MRIILCTINMLQSYFCFYFIFLYVLCTIRIIFVWWERKCCRESHHVNQVTHEWDFRKYKEWFWKKRCWCGKCRNPFPQGFLELTMRLSILLGESLKMDYPLSFFFKKKIENNNPTPIYFLIQNRKEENPLKSSFCLSHWLLIFIAPFRLSFDFRSSDNTLCQPYFSCCQRVALIYAWKL